MLLGLQLAKCVLYTIILCVHWRKIEGWEEVGPGLVLNAHAFAVHVPLPIKYVIPSFFLFIAFLFFFQVKKLKRTSKKKKGQTPKCKPQERWIGVSGITGG